VITVVTRRRLRRLELAEAENASLHRQLFAAGLQVQHERAAKDLVSQARDHAEHQATYWRERAERFLDQIAFKQGMIAQPTMTEPPGPPSHQLEQVFTAFGIGEIHKDHQPPADAARAAPVTVTGVDPTAAAEALAGLVR
jgi:hypothetical protein